MGHYYNFIRCAPNEWYKFDEEKVDYVQEDIILAEQAYILFYAKRDEPTLMPELNNVEDNDSHDPLQDVEIMQDEELKDALNHGSHGIYVNEKKRKLED
ncbi:hypothetical protein KY285_035943 [Solanum tuberosum]|nr:hypothetical protein KY285_035943 [Solanum tuberosum]